MINSTYILLLMGCVLAYMALSITCESIDSPVDTMARPTRPKLFSSPDELRTYLDQLGDYYAHAGRPRFGKRYLSPWMAHFARDESQLNRPMPITHSEILQLLSNANQAES